MIRVRVVGLGLDKLLAAHQGDDKLQLALTINGRLMVLGDATADLVDGGVAYDVSTVGPSEAEQWLAGIKK